MTREEAQELLPVIQAFAEGKAIQSRAFRDGYWYDVDGTNDIDWDAHEYRVKPELKYRPFRNAQECAAEMAKHLPYGKVAKLYYTNPGWHYDKDNLRSVILYDWGFEICDTPYYFKPTRKPDGSSFLTVEDLYLTCYAFADGAVFGVVDEEDEG